MFAAPLLLAMLVPQSALAARTWLLPSAAQVEGKEPYVTVDAALSDNLFDFERAPLPLDDLAITGPDGAAVTAENLSTGKLRSSFDVKLAKPGTYRISLVSDSVMGSYKVGGEQKRFRGTEEAFAKALPKDATEVSRTVMHNRVETWVSAGKPNDTALRTSGVGIELVPLTSPSELQAEQSADFRVFIDGKPAANLDLSVTPSGVKYRGALNELRVQADASGKFSVKWPEAGLYQITASWPPRPAPGEPIPQAARRLSYGGTVEVLPQ
jgi:uncharacterized GH25 family protein